MNYIVEIILIIGIILSVLICVRIYWSYLKNEKFETNLFYSKIPNIFLTDAYLNNLPLEQSEPEKKSLGEIGFDSYIYSDIILNRIICLNYTNQADCWDNNKCQWNEKKIGFQALGNPSDAYCDLAPKWLL